MTRTAVSSTRTDFSKKTDFCVGVARSSPTIFNAPFHSHSNRMAEILDKLYGFLQSRWRKEMTWERFCKYVLALALARKLLRWLLHKLQSRHARRLVGRWLLALPFARKAFQDEMKKEYLKAAEGIRAQWAKFGEPVTSLPGGSSFCKGRFMERALAPAGTREVLAMVDHWANVTNTPLADKQFSGFLYSVSLQDKQHSKHNVDPLAPYKFEARELKDVAACRSLNKELQQAFTYAFQKSYLWNSLHPNECAIGSFIDHQVVQIVADLFGARSREVAGCVTSGGTESNMVAARMYRDWARSNKQLIGTPVLLAVDSIHASVLKAGVAYDIEVVLVPTDENDQCDLSVLSTYISKYQSRLCAIFASGGSYSLGVVDQIRAIGAMAEKAGVGFHVDCCLSGFVVNFMDNLDAQFLAMPGVTSLSADTHKNGWAPKGSSVLVTRPIPDVLYGSINAVHYSIYSIPGWPGGVYGSTKDAGSQQVFCALHALIALLMIGREGYRCLAQSINSCARDMAVEVSSFPQLRLVGVTPPQVNVVGFALSRELQRQWGQGAIYSVAHHLELQGWVMSALQDDRLHFCVTARSAVADRQALMQAFRTALAKALEETATLAQAVAAGGVRFPGKAGMYGQLKAGLQPTLQNTGGLGKFLENYFIGEFGVEDAVKQFFLATLNPYTPRETESDRDHSLYGGGHGHDDCDGHAH
eukprot:g48540.t1